MSGANGYYAAGSVLQLTATPRSGIDSADGVAVLWSSTGKCQFDRYHELGDSDCRKLLCFSGHHKLGLANIAAQLAVSGTGFPTGTYSTPASVTWSNGTQCTVTATTPQGGPDTRYKFASWTDGSSANPRTITAASGATYSMTFTPEHKPDSNRVRPRQCERIGWILYSGLESATDSNTSFGVSIYRLERIGVGIG